MAVGSGAWGLGCRGCYLLGTFRSMRDPSQPLVYDHVAFLWNAARRWLIAPRRRAFHTLGLGTDRSDSLLFEGVTENARHLIPMFADAARNPHGCKLFLLTKSKNTDELEGLPTTNTIVTFSLNPEPIAHLWEGKWPDTLERITPPIAHRPAASLHAHYNFASVLAGDQRIAEALEQYAEALRLGPNHAKGRFNLGNLLARMDRLDEAVAEFRQSLAIDPDQGDVYDNLGTALSHLGRLDEALTTWRRGSRRLPHNGRLTHNMARILLAAADPSVLDYEAGLAVAIQAARTDQSDPDYALTVSFALLVNELYKESLAVANQAKRLGAVGMDCALITAIGLYELEQANAEGFYRRAIASPDAAEPPHAIRRALLARARSLFEETADP
ncbi:MAG: tetratricopeptide repeat protein [Planctomycetes bacterium]|nr:tetratricopeptide repeat protein [Planctomycetota bacterium]